MTFEFATLTWQGLCDPMTLASPVRSPARKEKSTFTVAAQEYLSAESPRSTTLASRWQAVLGDADHAEKAKA